MISGDSSVSRVIRETYAMSLPMARTSFWTLEYTPSSISACHTESRSVTGGVLFCLWNIVPGAASNSRNLCEMNFFDILEEAGIDYPDEKERVPENMRSDKWWRDNEKYN